jgi:hypothetical protein
VSLVYRKSVTRERNPALSIATTKRLNILLRIFAKIALIIRHIGTDFIDFKVIYSAHFGSGFSFKYQPNALTIRDTTVTLLLHVSA